MTPQQLAERFRAKAAAARGIVAGVIQAEGRGLLAEIRDRTPFISGDLKRAWKLRKLKNGIRLHNGMGYARWQYRSRARWVSSAEDMADRAAHEAAPRLATLGARV